MEISRIPVYSDAGKILREMVFNNKLQTAQIPFLYDVVRGKIESFVPMRMTGYLPSADKTIQDLHFLGGSYTPPDSPMQMQMVSSDASDFGVVSVSGTSESITVTGSGDIYTLTLTDSLTDFSDVSPGDCLLLDGDVVYAVVTNVVDTHTLQAETYTNNLQEFQPYRIIDDSASGPGARVVMVYYLDSNYDLKSEFIVMNGTTPVQTVANDILRVNRIFAICNGSNNAPVGQISLTSLDGLTTYRAIEPGLNEDQDCFFTVPRGMVLYITKWHICAGYSVTGRYVRAWLLTTSDHYGRYILGTFSIKCSAIVQDSSMFIEFQTPVRCPPRTDIKISVQSPETGPACMGFIEGWLEIES